jgi:phospholipid/cholesterol/gamma-HCH transport system substrate-binding protein
VRGRRNLPVFAGYAVIALLMLGFLARQMGGEFFLQPVYHLKAVFASGSQLVSGDDVTVAGLRIGRVDGLRPTQNGTEALLVLHPKYGFMTDQARAVIKTKNLLGETYVELARGVSPNKLKDGGTIPLDRTLTPVELAQVLQALNPTVRDHLVLLINSLGDALAGNGRNLNTQAQDLKQLAFDLDVISRTLVTNQQHFDRLLQSLGKIMETLASYHAEFRALIADWDRLMRALVAHEGDLNGAIREDAHVMALFDQALAGNAQGLHGALAEAPQTIDNTDAYLGKGTTIFTTLRSEVPSIDAVFDRLASAFSATDPNGQNMWRVYCVGGPSAPNPPAVTPQTPCFQGSP